MKNFRAPWDSQLRTLSIIVTLLMAGAVILIAGIVFNPAVKTGVQATLSLPAIVLVAAYAGSFLFAPLGYAAGNGTLAILRRRGSMEIKLSDIRTLRRLEDKEVYGSIRLFGVAGLFGYFGLFKNSALGTYTMYACRKHDMILIKTENKTFVIAPDKPDEFIRALKSAGVAEG